MESDNIEQDFQTYEEPIVRTVWNPESFGQGRDMTLVYIKPNDETIIKANVSFGGNDEVVIHNVIIGNAD